MFNLLFVRYRLFTVSLLSALFGSLVFFLGSRYFESDEVKLARAKIKKMGQLAREKAVKAYEAELAKLV